MYFPTKEGFLLNDLHIMRFEPVSRRDGSKVVQAVMTDGKAFELGDPQDFVALNEVRRLAIADDLSPARIDVDHKE